jgi:branched-chain amino acid aminotransferase/4-amino-4-deoxychorismate lyase
VTKDAVPSDDRGLLLGDGLFETLLYDGTGLQRFEAHLARMVRGCAVLGLEPPDPAAARRLALETLKARGLEGGPAVVRLTLTAGSGRGLERPDPSSGRLLCNVSPAADPPPPARLVTVQVRRNDSSPASRVKALSYLDNILARREARAAGADEALMLNTRGEVACAAAANLFWIAGRRLFTPALECGVLDGIMRAAALQAAEALGVMAVETRSGLEALEAADALFLTNSLVGLRPVAVLDGRPYEPHPLIDQLSSRCTPPGPTPAGAGS